MKGDFSRIRFNPDRQYTAVLEQQGRVALDADANEQAAIYECLSRKETIDVIGEYGAPIDDAGFAITIEKGEIMIGPGRYYVAGLMCENLASLSYDEQPFLINPDPTGAKLLTGLAQPGGQAFIQVFLQIWQRLVTPLDDPCLREPALGQADTTDRLQTVWRVVAFLRSPDSSGTAVGQPTPADCCAEMYSEAASAFPRATGKLSARTSGATADCGCEPIPTAGYRGLENQLYRVEIHKSGDQNTATFKWSRENGSVVAAIRTISGATIKVDSLGPDANLGFQPNQWVEITDDTYLFGQPPNQPGGLYQILSIDPANRAMTMTTPVLPVDTTRNARARRWDQSGASAASSGVPLSVSTWLDLENGIQVTFDPGVYWSGDYWTIPARTATGEIDWPPCGGDGAPFQSPHSIRVYVAPLACIHWSPAGRLPSVEDCRQLFSPLTKLVFAEANGGPPAGPRSTLNFIGAGVTVTDNPAAARIDITIPGSATGESSPTALLFPFVSSGFGFDTEIAVANTTADPFGTKSQPGTITFNYYPSPASGGPQVEGPIAGGQLFSFAVSTIVPGGFRGYIIAVCEFAGAYGFAYITDNTQKSTVGYPAVILPKRPIP